jgi:hypothetical protein
MVKVISPTHAIRKPSPEESEACRYGAYCSKKRGCPYFIHTEIDKISYMMDNDDIDPEGGEGGIENGIPELARF